MKSKQLLEWFCQSGIDGKTVNTIVVPDEGHGEYEQNEYWWLNMFGGLPPSPIHAGLYLYYYESVYPYAVCYNGERYMPDAQVEIPDENGYDYINLYLIED